MAPALKRSPSAETSPVLGSKKEVDASSAPLVHHSLITQDFEVLKFNAAAALQLSFGHRRDSVIKSDYRLISSPYNEEAHLLDLRTLDTSNQLLAKALTILQPIRQDYATAAYAESFNWQQVIDLLRDLAAAEGFQWKKMYFYVVVFRSQLYPHVDSQRLHELDSHSHEEASVSGGLLKYWFGTRDDQYRNLATCLWRSREDARQGGTGPWHKKARGAARDLYEFINFSTLKLVIDNDASAFEFSDWLVDDE